MIRFPFGAVSYLLAPGETTSVVINLRENARKQSISAKQKSHTEKKSITEVI